MYPLFFFFSFPFIMFQLLLICSINNVFQSLNDIFRLDYFFLYSNWKWVYSLFRPPTFFFCDLWVNFQPWQCATVFNCSNGTLLNHFYTIFSSFFSSLNFFSSFFSFFFQFLYSFGAVQPSAKTIPANVIQSLVHIKQMAAEGIGWCQNRSYNVIRWKRQKEK